MLFRSLRGAGPGALPLESLLLLVLAVIGFVAFVAYQRRAKAPLLNLALFRYPSFVAASSVAFIYGMALFGSTYLMPFFLGLVREHNALEIGTIMLVMSFVIAIIGYIGYRFLTRGERGSRIEALTTIAGSEG